MERGLTPEEAVFLHWLLELSEEEFERVEKEASRLEEAKSVEYSFNEGKLIY